MPNAAATQVRILETSRLILRRVLLEDAPFILELLNEPGWLRFIGDKGVRNLDDACNYLRTGPIASYALHGFGLYVVERKVDSTPLGLCGLLKRDTLPGVDIGFAFLERHQRRGYAREAAVATLADARTTLGLKRILAITTIDNAASATLLESLGMRFERMIKLSDEPELRLFAVDL
jgi:ribosomal-protein-alanine N-acetyltransferase